MAKRCTTHIFHSFRVAEDPKVSLPVMINVDGFTLTHVIEPIEFWTKDMVVKYLPQFQPISRLHPDKVMTMGAFGMPEIYVGTEDGPRPGFA